MFLDTSVLVALAQAPPESPIARRVRAGLASGAWTSPVNVGEYADWARRSGKDAEASVAALLGFVALVPITAALAVEGSRIKAEARKRRHARAFSLIDGISLACARSLGLPLLTLDAEFAGLPGATVLEA